MMVAERAMAPGATAPCSDQNNQTESITDEPPSCAFCEDERDVYRLDDKWICVDHIGRVVSMAANDVFSGDVHYNKAFEAAVLM